MSARVGLLFGGRSVEHEVSVQSARCVTAAMRESSLTCVPLAVDREGRWLSPELSEAILHGDAAAVDVTPQAMRVALDSAGGLLVVDADGKSLPLSIDVLFPLVHGWGGEDGRLQGALELAAIPYVGSGVLGSAAGMDKAVARILFEAHALPVCGWLAVVRHEYLSSPSEHRLRLLDRLGLPLFVKPANGGSSVGITRVARADELEAALAAAFEHDRTALVEVGLDAREIECAVLGNERPEASGLGEIIPSREFYDYSAKYVDGTSELRIPAELDEEQAAEIRRLALAAYRALGLCGFARVDFLLERSSGEAYLNEVNTLPGFTPISMFPKLWEAAGLAYPRLIERLVELAQERFSHKRKERRT